MQCGNYMYHTWEVGTHGQASKAANITLDPGFGFVCLLTSNLSQGFPLKPTN